MPHLCPTSWSAALISFWLILLLLNALIWWIQLPNFPRLNPQENATSSNLWSWN